MFDFAAGEVIDQIVRGERQIIGPGRIVAAERSINENPVAGGAIFCRSPTGGRFE